MSAGQIGIMAMLVLIVVFLELGAIRVAVTIAESIDANTAACQVAP